MLESVPFLLVLMMWDPAAEQESMQVFTRLEASREQCEQTGQRIAASRENEPETSRWAQSKSFAWRCIKPEYELSLREAPQIP